MCTRCGCSGGTGVGAGRLGAELVADVEALLVRRSGPGGDGSGSECLLVPIDACYRLVGLVRLHWRGFDGGVEAWREIDAFFAGLRALAQPVQGEADAEPAPGQWGG